MCFIVTGTNVTGQVWPGKSVTGVCFIQTRSLELTVIQNAQTTGSVASLTHYG